VRAFQLVAIRPSKVFRPVVGGEHHGIDRSGVTGGRCLACGEWQLRDADIRTRFLQERTSGVKRGAGSAGKWVPNRHRDAILALRSRGISGECGKKRSA
jgi:hypothetical protein